MQLFNRKKDDWIETKIEKATQKDVALVKSSDEFFFDWSESEWFSKCWKFLKGIFSD